MTEIIVMKENEFKGKRKAQNRKSLFRDGKPFIRPITNEDLWVIYAAYSEGSLPELMPGLDREAVIRLTVDKMNRNDENLLIDDDCTRYKNGRGPVGMVTVKKDLARIEPKFTFFKWATPMNILRSKVVYFLATSHNKKVGACVVRCDHDGYVELRNVSKEYGFLEYIGIVPNGLPIGNGDEYIFSVKGSFLR